MKSKMRIVIWITFCIGSKFSSAQNCFNDTHPRLVYKISREELLTQKEWVLTATGFDNNNNGVLDASENTIGDSHRGTNYYFDAEGTCTVYDNSLSCDSSPLCQFNWRWLGDDKLEIGSGYFSILQLNENEMVLSPDVPAMNLKFIMIYRH